jgi:hypothetical protein
MPTLLPLLWETDFVMHSANGDAKMDLPLIVGVSLNLLQEAFPVTGADGLRIPLENHCLSNI